MKDAQTFNINLQDSVIIKCLTPEPVLLSGLPSLLLVGIGTLGKFPNFMCLILK